MSDSGTTEDVLEAKLQASEARLLALQVLALQVLALQVQNEKLAKALEELPSDIEYMQQQSCLCGTEDEVSCPYCNASDTIRNHIKQALTTQPTNDELEAYVMSRLEAVGKIIRKPSGQITIQAISEDFFDVSKYVGLTLHTLKAKGE